MTSTRILPLVALAALVGCDGNADWVRGTPAATAYSVPLASDTTVVTTRRVWSSSGPNSESDIGIAQGAIMSNGTGMASTDWITGDPGVFDLTNREFHRSRVNDEPWDTGYASVSVSSPDASRVAVEWDFESNQIELRIFDVATGESRTVMTTDTAAVSVSPVAWTPAGDSVIARLWTFNSPRDDVKVVLIPASGGTPRLVHTIPREAWSVRWPDLVSLSPEGRWLLYTHEFSRDQQGRSDIYMIDMDGGGARPLVEHPARDRLVGWLPGTDVVLFSSDRSETTDLWSVRVLNGRASSEPRLVRSGFHRSEAIGYGDGALFYVLQTGSSGPAVIDVDPQTGALRGPASPPLRGLNTLYTALTWSPDGQTLAAPSWGQGSRTVTLHSMETGERRVFSLDENDRVVLEETFIISCAWT